nr:hypothetical protein [Nanoarchaeum sp.]
MEEFDALDKKLLYALDNNSRASISSLAKQIGVHRNVALYRFERLKKEGVIKGFFTEINPLAMNLKIFRIFFLFSSATKEEMNMFHEYIMNLKNVMWYFDVEGRWDKDVVFIIKNEEEFYSMFKELLFRFNKIINKYQFSVMTQLNHFPKDYLIHKNKTYRKRKTFSKVTNPDEKDLLILKTLSLQSDMSFIKLMDKTGLSINTLKERLKKLVKNNVILGFRPFIDTSKTGYVYYRIHFDLKNYNKDDFNQLKEYLHNIPNTVYDVEYLNGADIEIEMHLKGMEELKKIKEQIKEKFGFMINSLDSMEFSKEWIFRYFPNLD